MSFLRGLLLGLVFLGVAGSFAFGQLVDTLRKDEPGPVVGPYGDLARLEIQGANAVPPEAIRLALGRNFPCLAAAHPKAMLRNLIPTVREQMLLGYRHAGFAEAQVDLAIVKESRCLRATVIEGTCYAAGEVCIEGAKRIDAIKLIERLTKPYPPELAVVCKDSSGQTRWLDPSGNPLELLSPVWPQGKPAPLEGSPAVQAHWGAELSEKELPGLFFAVEKAIKSLGFYFPQFMLRIDLNQAKGEARLTVVFKSEGPEPVLAAVHVEGNLRNGREEILHDLQATPGMLLTREELSRIKTRLWSCGRYAKCDAKPLPLRTLDSASRLLLVIEVVEYPKAPRLSEPLSPAEETILRLRNWLAKSEGWQSDLVVSYRQRDAVFDTIVSPAQGTFFQISDSKADFLGAPIATAVVASRDELGVYSGRRKLTFQRPPIGLVGALGMRLQDDFLTEEDQPFLLTFGLGGELISRESKTPPFRVSLEFQPSAFLAHLYEHDAKASIDGGILSVSTTDSSSKSLLRVEERSGKLLEFSVFDLAAGNAEESPWSVRMFVKPGEYDRRLAAVQKQASESPNAFEVARPVSSTLLFLASEPSLADLLAKRPGASSLLGPCRTMLDRGIASPLDQYILALGCSTAKFVIPPPATRESTQESLQEIAAAYLLSLNNAMFPAGSWPWNLAAYLVPAAVGVPQGDDSGFVAILPHGPLSHYVTGCIFEFLGDGRVAACSGLFQGEASFQDDCQPLLDKRAIVGQCIHRGAEILRTMDDKDFEALRRNLPPEVAAIVCVARRGLCDAPNTPLDQALPKLMPQLWKAGIDKWLQSSLKAMQERNLQDASEAI